MKSWRLHVPYNYGKCTCEYKTNHRNMHALNDLNPVLYMETRDNNTEHTYMSRSLVLYRTISAL